MSRSARLEAMAMAVAIAGCASPSQAPSAPRPPESASAAPVAAPLASASATASASAALPTPRTPPPRACGALGCRAFPTAVAAFEAVLDTAPRVLAVGEAHAQAGARTPSTTARFTSELLPTLRGLASDVVIELWVANGSCGKVEQKVAEQQKPVTEPQAGTNQNEFLELGTRAKDLGIQPHALVPTCEQYARIAGAGAGDISEMLQMLRDVTERDVRRLLELRPPERIVVAYGGLLHNDLAPRPGREDFSFGPSLSKLTAGRYAELDVITPEQVQDTDNWRAQPWYEPYRAADARGEALLFSWAPGAYALILPPSPSPP